MKTKIKKTIINLLDSVPHARKVLRTLHRIGLNSKIYKYHRFTEPFYVNITKDIKFKIFGARSIYCRFYFDGLYNNWWETTSIRLWINLCKKYNNIVDVGANMGVYSLASASINPKANIFAFEPDSETFLWLKRNITLNKYDIKAYDTAISSHSGEKTFYASGNNLIGSFEFKENTHAIQVKAVSLDDFFKIRQRNYPDLIKIDVEGHEIDVIKGMSNILKHSTPIILVEVLNKENLSRIIKWFTDNTQTKYICFHIDEQKGVFNLQDIESHSLIFRNYLFVPREKVDEVDLLLCV